MKLITRDTDYAVRAITYLAKEEKEVVSVSELTLALKTPRAFLRKLLQTLNKEKILKSHKGVGGGFSLRKNPDDIYVVDLMRIFQGPLKLNECFLRKVRCPRRSTCILRKKISVLEEYVIKELKSITVASLLLR